MLPSLYRASAPFEVDTGTNFTGFVLDSFDAYANVESSRVQMYTFSSVKPNSRTRTYQGDFLEPLEIIHEIPRSIPTPVDQVVSADEGMLLQYFRHSYDPNVPPGLRDFSGAGLLRLNYFSFLFPLMTTTLFMDNFPLFCRSPVIRYSLLTLISWDKWQHGLLRDRSQMFEYLHKYHPAARNAIDTSAFLEIAFGCYILVRWTSVSDHPEEMKFNHFLGLRNSIRALAQSRVRVRPPNTLRQC